MKQFQRLSKHSFQYPQNAVRSFRIFFCVVDTVFRKLHIPVTEFIPDKVVDFLYRDTELVFVHILCHVFCQRVHRGQDPTVSRRKECVIRFVDNILLHIHKDETGCVPHLVCKIPARFYSLIVETHVVARRVSGHKCKPQRIGAVLVNDLKRINTISERFTHLASLGITHQSVNEHSVER